MKAWVVKQKLYLIGAVVGGIGGYLYWKFIGCATGTCLITGHSFNSTIYFAIMGAVLFGMFKK